MFAKIRSYQGISRILSYNELKLNRGKAECVYANRFVKDLDELSRNDKYFHFERLMSLNERTTKNAVHISISFFPGDKLSNDEFLKLIREYMQRIGFGHQPYLVYRHDDTRHPHFHVASTTIRKNGSRIEMRDIIKTKSLWITREMEFTHGLMRKEYLDRLSAVKVEYGRSALKPAIQNVLNAVIEPYKYRSFDELNAILSLYNVKAHRGKEGSRLHQYKGILYGLVDENGKSVGMPIKASSFDQKPTLQSIEKKIVLNEPLLEQDSQRTRGAINWTLLKDTYTNLSAFIEALEDMRISAVSELDQDGQLKRIFYVDHATRSVFDGEALGTNYNAQAIREECSAKEVPKQKESPRRRLRLNL